MHFAAIVERRLPHWYVHIPALGIGAPIPEPSDVQASAVALAAATTGVSTADLQVRLHLAGPGETVVPTSVTDVEVRHNDGTWFAAEQTGWVRQWNDSWWALVFYPADGAMWTRAVRPSSIRDCSVDASAVPVPRASVEPERLAPLGGGVRRSA